MLVIVALEFAVFPFEDFKFSLQSRHPFHLLGFEKGPFNIINRSNADTMQ
jgi:hypothetical protein